MVYATYGLVLSRCLPFTLRLSHALETAYRCGIHDCNSAHIPTVFLSLSHSSTPRFLYIPFVTRSHRSIFVDDAAAHAYSYPRTFLSCTKPSHVYPRFSSYPILPHHAFPASTIPHPRPRPRSYDRNEHSPSDLDC